MHIVENLLELMVDKFYSSLKNLDTHHVAFGLISMPDKYVVLL